MSTENLDRLRPFVEAWSESEWEPDTVELWVSEMTALLDAAVVYEDATMFDATFHGIDGVADAFRRWVDAFESTHVELVDMVGGGNLVVTVHRFRATARLTGIEFTGEYAYVWTFRDDRVVHYRSTADPSAALEAIGAR